MTSEEKKYESSLLGSLKVNFRVTFWRHNKVCVTQKKRYTPVLPLDFLHQSVNTTTSASSDCSLNRPLGPARHGPKERTLGVRPSLPQKKRSSQWQKNAKKGEVRTKSKSRLQLRGLSFKWKYHIPTTFAQEIVWHPREYLKWLKTKPDFRIFKPFYRAL